MSLASLSVVTTRLIFTPVLLEGILTFTGSEERAEEISINPFSSNEVSWFHIHSLHNCHHSMLRCTILTLSSQNLESTCSFLNIFRKFYTTCRSNQ